MSNRRELAQARKALEQAHANLAAIEALPRRVGSQVVWSNGVVWTRDGDNRWLPPSASQPDDMPTFPYTSAHVASGTIITTSGR